MNEALQNLLTRRSVRSYQDRQVDEAALRQILEASAYAPSAMGRQPVTLVAVQDPATVQSLSRMNAAVMNGAGDPFYGAPTVVIVLVDTDVSVCPMQDGSLAMGNLMNAAHALGVDSCWINRAKEVFETEEGLALLRKWGLKGNYLAVGNCILGYGKGDYPTAKPRTVSIVRV
ncbi:MAG: nitroreductase family protein [Eubacteriales bacterium]|nr:nitroreductase family protein [Eubacteriales bacterium]